MLRVGLTGGIGSGKSTVAARFRELGAIVVDADAVAREIVEPGEPALEAIVERFGPEVLDETGALRRAELGRLVFGDPQALADLEAITHPAIWARTAEHIAAAPADAIVVHDMPLIVEKGMEREYHLVIVVDVPAEERVRRLVGSRGTPEADARARIAAQADDSARRRAADVLLDNAGTRQDCVRLVDALWHDRLVRFAANLRHGVPAEGAGAAALSDLEVVRLAARVRYAAERAGRAAYLLDGPGPSATADGRGFVLRVRHLADVDEPAFSAALVGAGFPPVPGYGADGFPSGGAPRRTHASCDPGRPARLWLEAGEGAAAKAPA